MEKDVKHLENLLRTKERELNLLLEITQAISSNVSATGLLKLFEDILRNQIGVGKLAVFTLQDSWVCSNYFGVDWNEISAIADHFLPQFRHVTDLRKTRHELSKTFDIVIPVYHKETPLAFTFIGGMSPEKGFAIEEKLNYLQIIFNVVAVAIENKKLSREERKQKVLKNEMEMAGQMQNMLMSAKLPDNDRIQLSGIYLPHLEVGGDYYDYIELSKDECIFCIGDISGKGVAAALLMANFQASVRSLALQHASLRDLIEALNMCVNEITHGEKYVTFFLARYHFKTREYQYVSAGHNPAILFHKGNVKLLEEGCTILGMFEKLPYVNVQSLRLDGPAITLCYTDGLTDIQNEKKQHLEIHHLSEFIEENHELSAGELSRILVDYLQDFKGSRLRDDDVSILTCKIL